MPEDEPTFEAVEEAKQEPQGHTYFVDVDNVGHHMRDDDDSLGKLIVEDPDNLKLAEREKGIALNIDSSTFVFLGREGVQIKVETDITRIRIFAITDEMFTDLVLKKMRRGGQVVELPSLHEDKMEVPGKTEDNEVVSEAEEETGKETGETPPPIPKERPKKPPKWAKKPAMSLAEHQQAATEGTGTDTFDAADAAKQQLGVLGDDVSVVVSEKTEQEKPWPEMEQAILHFLEDRAQLEERRKAVEKRGGEAVENLRKAAEANVAGLKDIFNANVPWAMMLLEVRAKVVDTKGEEADDARPSEIIREVGRKHSDTRVIGAVDDFLYGIAFENPAFDSKFLSKRVKKGDVNLMRLWVEKWLGISVPDEEQEVGGGGGTLDMTKVLAKLNSNSPAVRQMGMRQLLDIAPVEFRACCVSRDFNKDRASKLLKAFELVEGKDDIPGLAEFTHAENTFKKQFVGERENFQRQFARRSGDPNATHASIRTDEKYQRAKKHAERKGKA